MKLRLTLATVLSLFLAGLAGSARPAEQDTPDFSGRWVLESGPQTEPAADIPRSLSVSLRLVRTNVRGEPVPPFFKDMIVTREFAGGAATETYQLGIQGGRVAGVGSGRLNEHHSVLWDKQALVIETGSHTGAVPESGQWAERRETWSLDSDGRLRLEIVTRSSGSPPTASKLMYRRQ